MERPRLPLTWADWVSGDWLGTANPLGVMKLTPPLMLQTILDGARSRLRGRDLVVRHGDGELRLHLDDLGFDLAALPLTVGQLGTIQIDASDVVWPGGQLDTLRVEFANVHIRPGFTPMLVSAPIRLHATVGQAALDGFLSAVASKVRVELGEHTATALRPGRESWGNAAVEPRVEAGKVRLVATAISVRSRALRAPGGGVPSLLVDLPPLPGGMQVQRMSLGDHVVHVDALVEELQEPITAQQLANVSSLVRVGAPEIDLTPEATG